MTTIQEVEVVNTVSNYVCDVNSNNFMIGNTKITTIVDNENEMWIYGTQIAKHFEYNKPADAIKNNVSNKNKKAYENISLQANWIPDKSFIGMQKRTYFINISGLNELLMESKKQEAIMCRRWIANDVLRSIQETGTYTINNNALRDETIESLSIEPIINPLQICDERQGIYIASVGNYNGEHIYKLGRTANYATRHKQHLKTYKHFILHEIKETSNMQEVERMFKRLLNNRGYMRPLKIDGKDRIELFAVKDIEEFYNIMSMLDEIIENKP